MTEDSKAVGAFPRVDAISVSLTHGEFRRAVLKLGQVVRLHIAEAVRALGTDMTRRDVVDAWISADKLLEQALAEIEAVEARMSAQIHDVTNAVAATEEDAKPRNKN